MTLWIGFKQQNFAPDNKIGPNEEQQKEKVAASYNYQVEYY